MSIMFLLTLLIGGRLAVCAFSAQPPALTFPATARCQGHGVYLTDLFPSTKQLNLPKLRLSDAPEFGQAALLTRDQVSQAIRTAIPSLNLTNLAGADRCQVIRHARSLDEMELKERLTVMLQEDYARDMGELELRTTRPWIPVQIPDEDVALRILDLPSTGISPYFIVRFEVRTDQESIGTFQVPLQAKVWKDIWVTRSIVRRGMIFTEADVARERRDVLSLREAPLSLAAADDGLEIAENLVAGSPLYERSVRLRPVMRRGQVIEAKLHEGIMMISLKVELLEDGAPGQIVRVRNMNSKREFRGKVINESSIVVAL
jgi:flagella basal body P-ring formation protein FlgA